MSNYPDFEVEELGSAQAEARESAEGAARYAKSPRLMGRFIGMHPILVGLASILLATACSPTQVLPSVNSIRPSAPTAPAIPPELSTPTVVIRPPEATPTLMPGGGGTDLQPFPKGHPSESLNTIIDAYNAGKPTSNADLNRINAAKLEEAAKASKPEVVKDISKCVFIKDPTICVLGQPETRSGKENEILGIKYNDISGTPIHTRTGHLSPRWDNQTQEVVGLSIDFPDGTSVNISSDKRDLVIKNPLVRLVKEGEIVAEVGKSGEVVFSTGAKRDPQTGEYVTPQAFFKDNFPTIVTSKPKVLLQASTGTRVVITKKFEDGVSATPTPHP